MTLEQAKAQALKARPDLTAQQEREANARLSASATKHGAPAFVGGVRRLRIELARALNNSVPTRTVGIQLRVPLFDGGRRDARRAESADSQYRPERSPHQRFEGTNRAGCAAGAGHSGVGRRTQVKVAEEGLELADNELTQARRRYDAGVAISLEVTDAQTRLERARDNQTEALLQLQPGADRSGAGHGACAGA